MSENYLDSFAKAVRENLLAMADLESEIGHPIPQLDSFASSGIAVIIGITGKRPGRIIFDTSQGTAHKISQLINGEDQINEELMLDTLAEFGNIVSGHATTIINNLNKGYNLMLTPPSIFFGAKLNIISPKLQAEFINVKTPAGDLTVSVGFERGK